jgi:hypothetical protein
MNALGQHQGLLPRRNRPPMANVRDLRRRSRTRTRSRRQANHHYFHGEISYAVLAS